MTDSLLLYALELTAFLVLLALYKKVGRPMSVFLPTPAGKMMILGAGTFTVFAIALLVALRSRTVRRRFLPTLALNVGVLAVLFLTAEITIRALASPSPSGPYFGDKLLLPRSWEHESARQRAVLTEAAVRHSYLAPDADLGWSIRPSARSKDYNLEFELAYLRQLQRSSPGDMKAGSGPRVSATDDSVYQSSAEGLRSPRAGMSFAALPHRHRIALVGDSFTFGLEVRYEETWGQQLETALGGDYQILNFGVDGYGVDQAYLHFRRDVIQWHPDVVILGVVSDDLHRTMCVYGFLCFPGSEMPFSKPRFVVVGDSLQLLPRPANSSDSVFAKRTIAELPLIQYDHDFDPYEWDWHSYDHSYAIRYLLSRYRRWSPPRPAVDNKALASVNAALFRAFV
ncbi:MAG TPA: hypothetical protein VJO33_18695, partial [Gemmatimonadaceae bacterium]|nr:hypothetical protein [Gemmatimonadaceae bacterium]